MKIKTWQQRCNEHPAHRSGMVSWQMMQDRMQEEIDELRAQLEKASRLVKILRGHFSVSVDPKQSGIIDSATHERLNSRQCVKCGSSTGGAWRIWCNADGCPCKHSSLGR